MANQRAVYDPKQRETPEFKTLYRRYYSPTSHKYREAFGTFQEFYDWAMATGFVLDARLACKDPDKPYTPDNLIWTMPQMKQVDKYGIEVQESIKRWNETVNRIRVHYGLKPLRTERRFVNDETVL